MPDDPQVRRLVGQFKRAWQDVRSELRNGGAVFVPGPRVTLGVLDKAIEHFERTEKLTVTLFRSRGRTRVSIWIC